MLNRIEAQFIALRYYALDSTSHASHKEQASMIRPYIIWRNNHAHDERLRRIVGRDKRSLMRHQHVITCACGHNKAAHEHYRAETDCGLCDCPRWRRRWRSAIRDAGVFYDAGWEDALYGVPPEQPAARRPQHLQVVPGG